MLCPLPSFTSQQQQSIKIDSTSYRVVRQLGEGGFSIVYLIETPVKERFAMKQILCPQGSGMKESAMCEIDAYKRFHHPNIIPLVGALVEPSRVSMVFPLYESNLFDLTMHNEQVSTRLPEDFVIRVFRGVCAAVEYLHTFDVDDELAPSGSMQGYTRLQGPTGPFVHRDIKLGNVMLSNGTPILMDFGSVAMARFTAHTRADALRIQDTAASQCSLPYRAPELFDVQPGMEFDERTDVWSLGCLLFALAANRTPFENDGSIVLAAINKNYTFPEGVSEGIEKLVAFMLVPEPGNRPFIGQVIQMTNKLYPV
ncbi:kinase-like domain-containing protein [Coemansia spiralis]|nr:kinase-like domain-containing protein [Coemansia spiralis]